MPPLGSDGVVAMVWNRRSGKPAPSIEVEWLSEERIEGIRSDCMADDIDVDMAALCLKTEAEITDYFDNGGAFSTPEHSVTVWLKQNVPNAVHRRKLDIALRAKFTDLRAVLRALGPRMGTDMEARQRMLSHEAMQQELLAETFTAELLGESVPEVERRFIAKALVPLCAKARVAAPGEWQSDEKAFVGFLRSRLDGVGWGAPLPWETEAALSVPRKPTASLRLFCLGGISETSASFQEFLLHAPKWLEVRPLELPGHGFREGLEGTSGAVMGEGELAAPCTLDGYAPLRLARAKLAAQLVDEIEALTEQPYALWGFSLGAMMVYLMAVELQRRGRPLPSKLIVSGRGAPHLVPRDYEFYARVLGLDEEATLDDVEEQFFDVRAQTADLAKRQASVVQRWRLGQIYALLHEGGEGDKDEDKVEVGTLVSGAVPVRCPVTAINSDIDALWKLSKDGDDFGPWEQLAAATAQKPQKPFQAVTVRAIEHFDLLKSGAMAEAVLAALAEALVGVVMADAGAAAAASRGEMEKVSQSVFAPEPVYLS